VWHVLLLLLVLVVVLVLLLLVVLVVLLLPVLLLLLLARGHGRTQTSRHHRPAPSQRAGTNRLPGRGCGCVLQHPDAVCCDVLRAVWQEMHGVAWWPC
jgi:hypothetical protein